VCLQCYSIVVFFELCVRWNGRVVYLVAVWHMIRSVFCLRSMLSMVLQHWLTVADIRYLLILYRSSICYLMGKLFTHTHTCALVTARMIWYSVPQDGDAVWLGVELHCTEFIVSLSLGLWLSHVLFHAVWRIVLLWCFDSDCFPYHCPPVKKPYTFFVLTEAYILGANCDGRPGDIISKFQVDSWLSCVDLQLCT